MKSILEELEDFDTSAPTSLDDFIERLQERGFETSELEPILRAEGKQEIIATAGAGKSTALSLIYAKDKLFGALSAKNTPEGDGRIAWVTTFVKEGAKDLERNVNKALGDMNLFELSTSGTSFKNMHSEFRELLVLAGVNLDNKNKAGYVSFLNDYDPDKPNLRSRLLKKLIREFDLGKYPEYPTVIEMNFLESIINRYRNTIRTEFKFGGQELEATEMSINYRNLPAIVERFAELRAVNNVIDFTDMLEKVYQYFVNPETRVKRLYNLYVGRYRYLMFDEFQDTSELQYELLKPLFETCERVVIVGDPDQSIYSFNSANPDVMTWFRDEYEPNMHPLSVSRRCPSNILEPIANSIKYNSNRLYTQISSSKEGGLCVAQTFVDMQSMVQQATKIINEAILEGQTVAVVSRMNFSYSPALIGYLTKYNSYFNIYGDAYTLDKAKYKRVWSLIEMVRGRGLNNISANLRTLCEGVTNNYQLRQLEGILANSIPKTGNVVSYLDTVADYLNEESYHLLSEKISQSFDAKGVADEMTVFKILLEHVKFHGKSLDAEVVDTILTLANESETVDEFFENMDFVNNAMKESSSKTRVAPLSFATVHGFKGKEADVVIVFDASKGVFPSSRTSTEDLPSVEEERRNFFVAGTRAIKSCYYLAKRDSESPFLMETGLKYEPITLVPESSVIKTNSQSLRERLKENAPTDVLNEVEDWGDFDF